MIQTLRFNDGTRRVTGISEVLGLDEQTNYKLQPIFRFRNEGELPDGTIQGRHVWSKLVPTFAEDVVGRGLTRFVKLTAPIFNLEAVGKEDPATPTRAIA